MQTSGNSLEFASDELKADKQVVDAAKEQNVDAGKFALGQQSSQGPCKQSVPVGVAKTSRDVKDEQSQGETKKPKILWAPLSIRFFGISVLTFLFSAGDGGGLDEEEEEEEEEEEAFIHNLNC